MIICLSKVNGGMELASVKLAKLLSHDVPIEFLARDTGYIQKEHSNTLQQHNIKVHIAKFSSNFSLKLIVQVRNLLIKNHIKNIIFLGASEMKSLYCSALGLDINFIIRQGSKKTTSKKDIFHQLFYSNVSHFVGNCEYMKQNIIDILPIPKKAHVHRVYSSLNLPQSINFKTYNGRMNLIHVGRVHPGKGQLEAIKACEVLSQNNFEFHLQFLGDIQDKTYYEEIQNYLKDKPYRNSVEFVGYTNTVKTYLEKSDIFIFPSLGEGMSNAIIEALGFGLIPIIYDDTSSSEFKDLGFHIYLTKENNIKNLQEILLDIANNLSHEKDESQKNHKKALEIFALNREKSEYLNLLQ